MLDNGSADYTPGVSRRSGGATTFAHAGLKNTTAQSAENETVAANRAYDAFGNVVSSTGTWSGPFGYAGNFGYHEDGSGLKLLGHRYYDPSLGRFISQDPVSDGRNWYAYAESQPVSLADPTGQWALVLAFIGIAIVLSSGVAEAPTGNETAEDFQRHRYEAAQRNVEIASWLVPTPGGAGASTVVRTLGARAATKAAIPLAVNAGSRGGVYVLKSADEVYVGQSMDIFRRIKQWRRSADKGHLTAEVIAYVDDPIQRRLKEQSLIEYYRAQQEIQLLNKINSISRKNPLYEHVTEYRP